MVPGMGTIDGGWASSQARATPSGSNPLPHGDVADQVDHGGVAFPGLGGEARDGRTDAVAVLEGGGGVYGAGEEAFAEGLKGTKPIPSSAQWPARRSLVDATTATTHSASR